MKRIAIIILLAAVFSTTVSSQSVKYNGIAEIDFVGTRKLADAQIGISTSHGVYLSRPQLYAGVGVAVAFNVNVENIERIYPIYVEIRKDFPFNRHLIAFIDAKIGYSLQEGEARMQSNSNIDYGFYCNPGIGFRFPINNRCGIFLKAGYTYQHVTDSYSWFADKHVIETVDKYNAGGFSISLGFSF